MLVRELIRNLLHLLSSLLPIFVIYIVIYIGICWCYTAIVVVLLLVVTNLMLRLTVCCWMIGITEHLFQVEGSMRPEKNHHAESGKQYTQS